MKEAAFPGTVNHVGKQRILLFIISETVVSLSSTILKIATRITAASRPEATRASRVFAVFAIPSHRSTSPRGRENRARTRLRALHKRRQRLRNAHV